MGILVELFQLLPLFSRSQACEAGPNGQVVFYKYIGNVYLELEIG